MPRQEQKQAASKDTERWQLIEFVAAGKGSAEAKASANGKKRQRIQLSAHDEFACEFGNSTCCLSVYQAQVVYLFYYMLVYLVVVIVFVI